MIGQRRHLNDDRLYECVVAAQTGDAVDPRVAEHLADCAECHARYAEVATFMTAVRADADAEVDALYSAEALRAQQAHITRRLEHLGHAARVITFPRHANPVMSHGIRITPPWLAAAAAAGLFIGVGLGSVLQPAVPRTQHAAVAFARQAPAPVSVPLPAPKASTPAPAQPVAAAPPASTNAASANADADSDEFLNELEFALERPRTSELRALDDLTPHVREISLTTRVQ